MLILASTWLGASGPPEQASLSNLHPKWRPPVLPWCPKRLLPELLKPLEPHGALFPQYLVTAPGPAAVDVYVRRGLHFGTYHVSKTASTVHTESNVNRCALAAEWSLDSMDVSVHWFNENQTLSPLFDVMQITTMLAFVSQLSYPVNEYPARSTLWFSSTLIFRCLYQIELGRCVRMHNSEGSILLLWRSATPVLSGDFNVSFNDPGFWKNDVPLLFARSWRPTGWMSGIDTVLHSRRKMSPSCSSRKAGEGEVGYLRLNRIRELLVEPLPRISIVFPLLHTTEEAVSICAVSRSRGHREHLKE